MNGIEIPGALRDMFATTPSATRRSAKRAPMNYRAKWDALERLPTNEALARALDKMSGRTMLAMLRWNDRNGDFPSQWGKYEAGSVLMMQISEDTSHPVKSYEHAQALFAKVKR